MDMMAMVSSMLAMQAAGTQANLAPGVGGNLNIAA
jgi:hypothetical protein